MSYNNGILAIFAFTGLIASAMLAMFRFMGRKRLTVESIDFKSILKSFVADPLVYVKATPTGYPQPGAMSPEVIEILVNRRFHVEYGRFTDQRGDHEYIDILLTGTDLVYLYFLNGRIVWVALRSEVLLRKALRRDTIFTLAQILKEVKTPEG